MFSEFSRIYESEKIYNNDNESSQLDEKRSQC
jgi:hypothetical protein